MVSTTPERSGPLPHQQRACASTNCSESLRGAAGGVGIEGREVRPLAADVRGRHQSIVGTVVLVLALPTISGISMLHHQVHQQRKSVPDAETPPMKQSFPHFKERKVYTASTGVHLHPEGTRRW